MADVNIKSNDRELVWVPPQSDTDERVPTAEELRENSKLALRHLEGSRGGIRPAGLMARPVFTPTVGSKGIVIAGLQPYFHKHPAIDVLPSAYTLQLPALPDTVSSVSRYDRIYVLGFSALVTDEIDPDIRFTFTWRDQTNALQTVTKENTRRSRDFFAFVWAPQSINATTVLNALTTSGTNKTLTVNKQASGVSLSTIRLYPLDANLVDNKTYIIDQASLELVELLRVWRVQNSNQGGYFWGRNGEKDFDSRFHLQPSYRYVGDGWQDWVGRSRETLYRILQGESLSDTPTKDRAVQNLVNGQVGTNLDAPGIATASPNGSTALANEQRVRFTNEAITQRLFCLPVVTTDAGGGVARASVNFAGNSPAGAKFSANSADHKVFSAAGVDVSASGTFTGLDGTGALTWTESSSPVSPGDTVYVVPGIVYPAGSGFPVAGQIERVYVQDGAAFTSPTALNAANVREYVNDLTGYQNPANSEPYIVVMDRARAGLRYIYKKITVTSSGAGVVVIPATARGLIAFISGPNAPTGRQDKPVLTGLDNNTNYDLLCYHAPPGSEQWQFQLVTPRYAGSGEKAWLDGARVNTQPVAIAHSQGAGNTNAIADGAIQHEAIAFRLPWNTATGHTGVYTFNTKILFGNEADLGEITFREILPDVGANGLMALRPGVVIDAIDGANTQSQGMAVLLKTETGLTLGIIKRKLATDKAYQLVVACDVEKNGEHRLLVVTLNEGLANQVNYLAFDSDSPDFAGIDIFKHY